MQLYNGKTRSTLPNCGRITSGQRLDRLRVTSWTCQIVRMRWCATGAYHLPESAAHSLPCPVICQFETVTPLLRLSLVQT